MEQQAKSMAGQAAPAPTKQMEQYKQEMLAQARRGGVQITAPAAQSQAAAQAQATAQVNVITAPPPAHVRLTPAEHAERILERTEPIVEAVEPFAEVALHSGLAAAGAAAAAKGIELGVEALEDHIEHRRAGRQEHTAPPPAPPAPAAPVVDINFTQQIEQTAPAVTAPTVVTPTIVAPAAVTQTAPPPAPPVQPVPLPTPIPPPQKPVPVPLPPIAPPLPPRPPIAPPPPASVLIPPMLAPVAVPMQPVPIPVAVPQPRPVPPVQPPCARAPMECETVTCTVQAAPCRRPARPRCPIHNPRPQPCCAPRRPTPPSCRPASCACMGGTSRAGENTSWFTQPAVEAAYAAYTAALAPEDDATPAYYAPQAVPVSAALSAVAFAGQDTFQQPGPGYYELPVQEYASLEDYLARNTARGILELQVRVASDDGAPVPGANVDVMRTINGVTYLFYHGVTDANGSAGRIALPAPDRSLSFTPPQGFVPYAVYTVSVSHGDYAPQVFENVTVFPDTESVQVVRLGMAGEPSLVDEGRYVM